MRKKFTMLLTALLAFVGVAKAQFYDYVIESVGENITDLSALTEDSYVALYNVGRNKFIYEGGNYKLYMGTDATVGAIWQVHKEGDKFLFTSATTGRYFSTPLDGNDVVTVTSDNAAKDMFTITAHVEDNTKWLVKSSNANIYWDAQDARFVGWAGNGANSRYEIRPVAVSKSEVTENDFTKLITTSEDDIKWYTIKNVKSGKYATYAGDAATMTQQETVASAASLFYFTGRATTEIATVGIHNLVAGDNLCAEYNSWTATGREWYIKKQSTGMSICTSNGEWNAWNNAGGGGQKVEYWSASDGGSAWQIEIVTNFTEYLTAAKAAAIAEINNLSGVSAIYANVAEQFKTEIEDVTENSAEGLLAVNNILENFRKSIDGKSMKFRVDGRGSRFLGYSKANDRIETQVLAFDDAYWTLKYVGNGYFKLYNPVHKVWLGAPDGAKKTNDDDTETKYTAGLANEADASLYKFEVTTGGNTVLLVAGNGNIAHAAGDNRIMSYGSKTDQASWWTITDVVTFSMTYDEYKEFLSEKSVMMNNLIGYAKQLQDNYGLVKSGDKIAVVVNHPSGGDSQPSSNLLDGNNGTYVHSSYDGATMNTVDNHYIEVELSEATQKIFCYFSKRNNSNRPSVVKVLAGNSADALAEVATLNLQESADDNVQSFFSGAIDLSAAYTHLRFVVTKTNTTTKFFTLSEFYVLPVNTTIEGIAALAGASIADTDLEARLIAAEKSLKNLQLPETLAEVSAALEANVSNHKEEPQLGQYTTVAYNELKAAYEACTTIDQLDAVFAAFDKFNKAKNLPVFTISNGDKKDYTVGKSIYDDNSGTLHFKDTDIYDKTMWWALDQVETTVGVTGDNYVGIYNVGTGNGFWGAASIKVAETSDAVEGEDDGLFLFYTIGDNTPIHFQANYSEIVRYGSTEATSGSAAKFTYIGNTYDLNKLTDGQIAALKGLENTFNAKAYLVSAQVGTGAGQYQGDYNAFYEKFYTVDQLLTNGSLTSKASLTVDEINQHKNDIETLAAALTLNTPVDETYFRIQGANSEVTPAGWYITGHTNADGGRIALTAEADASTIYYYKDGHLQAYQSGKYIALSGTYYTFDAPAIDDKEAVEASAIEFAASSYIAGAYTIKSADRYLHYKVYNGAVEVDRCQSEESADDSWYLVEVEKQTITYIYKDGETELARQEVTEFAGMRYPAADATLPLGYTAAALEGNIAVGETEKVIACTLNAEAIPFNYYESFDAVEQWYYLNFTAAKNYLYYAGDNTVLDATKTEIDRTNREAYAWAFIGTPATGFQVVNKLAGNAKGLKALESGAAVGEGAHTFKVTASDFIADAKGFFMAATNGESADRFNKQDNKVVYWSGADAGSTFTVIECPFGAVAELEALIVAAEALKATVGANTGDKIGEFSEETASVLADAITNAKSKGDAATAEDVAALQAVIDGTKIILPTAGKYYQFHSAVAFADTKAVYSDDSKALWKTLNDDDKVFYWEAVENEGGIALKNAKDGKFLNGNAGQSGAWSVSDTPANIDVIIITKEDNEKGYQYGLVLNNWQMHANGHGEGSGTASNIVSWNNTEVGKASAWYIKEVELPEFCEITYVFKCNGIAIDKFTQRAELKAGAEFPEIAISLPYGVSTNATKPDGTVTTSQTFEFTLNIDKALPFETAADAAGITKWYYMQMHANPNVTAYIEDAGNDNVAWNNKSVDDAEIESHLWGFVGDVWTGVKVINKSGRAIVSTSGAAVLGAAENATAFIPTVSNGVLSDWFCLKYPESNYLNAQGDQSKGEGIVSSYDDTDNGSSFFVTEADKEFSVTVNDEAGYSTYYSNFRLAIPETVKAYIIDKVDDGKSINLKQVEGVLPANTGIILEGAGTHTFVTSAAQTADVSRNLLKGTAAKTLITAEENTNYYVLAMPEGEEVGLYKAALNKDANGNKVTENGVAFHNGANKAYLPVVVEDAAEAPAMYSFTRGDETTDIEGSELDAQGAMLIYDLAGRRVEKMVKGIYIVNGKKVLVK